MEEGGRDEFKICRFILRKITSERDESSPGSAVYVLENNAKIPNRLPTTILRIGRDASVVKGIYTITLARFATSG